MTRIFGYDRKTGSTEHIPNHAQGVLDNLQEALVKTYEKGWQAYGLGFIVVGENGAKGYSVYKGYRGITDNIKIEELLPPELHSELANNPKAFFGVLQNGPDNGEVAFEEDKGREFPLQSENWLAITMGWWGNDNFNDEKLPWYNESRPALSIIQYLETNTATVNFDWVDKKRTPFIIAVKKDSGQVLVVDNYTGTSDKGIVYAKDESENLTLYLGVRNQDGYQV